MANPNVRIAAASLALITVLVGPARSCGEPAGIRSDPASAPHHTSPGKAIVESSAFSACRESSLVCCTTTGTSEAITLA